MEKNKREQSPTGEQNEQRHEDVVNMEQHVSADNQSTQSENDEVKNNSVANHTEESTADETLERNSDEETSKDEIIELNKSEYDQLVQDKDLAEDKHLRYVAETENFKKRTRKEYETLNKYKSQSVIESLLPTLDNFERALSQFNDKEDSFYKGVEMTYNSLLNTLKEHGLEIIEDEGAQFDPNLHQAVMQEANDDVESGYIIESMQKGYKLKDRVIRPSMVKVSE